METSNILSREFKTLVIKMLKELKKIDEPSENWNKEIDNIKMVNKI